MLTRVSVAAARASRTSSPLSKCTARFASTSTSGETLSPAVAWLVGAKGIDSATVRRLPRSGPKNRLLKGDVLKYLANPSILDNAPAGGAVFAVDGSDEPLLPAAYYGSEVVVNDLVTFVKNYNDTYHAALSVSDLFTRAAHLALKAVPEVNAKWVEANQKKEVITEPRILITRLAPLGSARMLLEKPEDVGGVKLSKIFQDNLKAVEHPGTAFTIFDAVLSPLAEVTAYPTSRHPVNFTIGSIRKESQQKPSSSLNDLDLIFGAPNKSSTKPSKSGPPDATIVLESTKPKSKTATATSPSDIDFFAQPPPSSFYTGSFSGECEPRVDYVLDADLVVDERAVSAKVADKFLATWAKLLKNPKALL
ncbi:uncharacterized protein EV422DRAFT_566486 [Fimicolochytrium jonesii]|uniref:uncharacterized protein n=1 Tax=Fimicolochytrium jonesii TaxID=1396493 RepID=UPI0022FE5E7F|nr:uncharacterized protein EV422DRAFT_566486 [Fimicolochytrium jonesii]KAI8822061.1 hypothetical protein EV422DRAFT_566486 [Fimicolochytrium jonesii]